MKTFAILVLLGVAQSLRIKTQDPDTVFKNSVMAVVKSKGCIEEDEACSLEKKAFGDSHCEMVEEHFGSVDTDGDECLSAAELAVLG